MTLEIENAVVAAANVQRIDDDDDPPVGEAFVVKSSSGILAKSEIGAFAWPDLFPVPGAAVFEFQNPVTQDEGCLIYQRGLFVGPVLGFNPNVIALITGEPLGIAEIDALPINRIVLMNGGEPCMLSFAVLRLLTPGQ